MLEFLNDLLFGSGQSTLNAIAPLALAAIFAATQAVKQKQANQEAKRQTALSAISTKFSPFLSAEAQQGIKNTPGQGDVLTNALIGGAEGYLASKLSSNEGAAKVQTSGSIEEQAMQPRKLQPLPGERQGPSKFNNLFRRASIED